MLAERGGFELPEPVKAHSLSRRAQSTTLPPLRCVKTYISLLTFFLRQSLLTQTFGVLSLLPLTKRSKPTPVLARRECSIYLKRPRPEQLCDGTQPHFGHSKFTCKSMVVAMPAAGMRAGFAQFTAFSQDAKDNKIFEKT